MSLLLQRRAILKALAASPFLSVGWAQATSSANSGSIMGNYQRLLILVELKGGNDALNMLVPYADPNYYSLRPRIAIKRDDVLQLSAQAGFHPSMTALMPIWQAKELAVVQGVGYPQANLSHFRSIEIWDTASKSDEYLHDGWLARAFNQSPTPRNFVADGVIVGSAEMGPLQGVGPRAIVLSNPEQFVKQARLASMSAIDGNPALAHLRRVEDDVVSAAARLQSAATVPLTTVFPGGQFGDTVKSACRVLAAGGGVATLRLTQTGYDTHQNQPGTQANLLGQLAEGLAALRNGLIALGLWDRTLVMTYAEFGRRVRENQSNGTDHGTAAAHLVMGGKVKGSLYGQAPRLDQLDADGNVRFTTDFRQLYSTALQSWWGLKAETILQGRFTPLDLLKA